MRIITLLFLLVHVTVWAQIQKRVTIALPQILQANAGSDKQIVNGNSVQIGGTPTAKYGNPGYTYQWSPGTGLTGTTVANPQASPSQTTTYFVAITDSKGCTDTDTAVVTVVSSGIEENLYFERLDLKYNNYSKTLIVENNSDHNFLDLHIEIFNLLGQLVYSAKEINLLKNNTFQLDCMSLPDATYILRIEQNSQTVCKKFATF